MNKNVATKIALFAFTTTTGVAKTGDAANITAYVSKDYGAVTPLTDTSATEMDATNAPGWYLFDVAQAESNADALLFTGKSTTANISVVGQHIFTTPASFTAFTAPLDASGTRTAVGLASANLDTQIAAVAAYIDTEVADIKAKTDLIPASPAAVGSAMTLANASITAAVIATGAIDADAIAADAVTEIQAGLSTLDAAGVRTAVGMDAADLDAQLGALPTGAENATAMLAATVYGAVTFAQHLRRTGAVTSGLTSGAGTDTETFYEIGSGTATPVVVMTVTADGERTAVTFS